MSSPAPASRSAQAADSHERVVETTSSSSSAAPPRLADRFKLLAQAAEASAAGSGERWTPASPTSTPGGASPTSPATSNGSRTTSADPRMSEEHPKHPRKKRWTGVRNCDACRIRKSKCDRLRPCSNCAFRNVKCTYDEAFDSFPMVAVEHNHADISRLCQNVFALARCLNMSSDELDKLSTLADELVDKEQPSFREVPGNAKSSNRRRSLGEILRMNPQFNALDTDLSARRKGGARPDNTSSSTPSASARTNIPPNARDERLDAALRLPPRPSSLPHLRHGPPLMYHPMQQVAPQIVVYGPGPYSTVYPSWPPGYASRGVPANGFALRPAQAHLASPYAVPTAAPYRAQYSPATEFRPRLPSAPALSKPLSAPSSGRLSPAVLPPLAIPVRASPQIAAANPSPSTPSTAISALTPFRSAYPPSSATTPPSARPPSGTSPSFAPPHGGHYVLPPIHASKRPSDSFSTHLASFASTASTSAPRPSSPIRLAPLRSIPLSEDVEMADGRRSTEPNATMGSGAGDDGQRRLPSLSDALARAPSDE